MILHKGYITAMNKIKHVHGVSQWETLHFNVVSHWLSAYTEWSLTRVLNSQGTLHISPLQLWVSIVSILKKTDPGYEFGQWETTLQCNWAQPRMIPDLDLGKINTSYPSIGYDVVVKCFRCGMGIIVGFFSIHWCETISNYQYIGQIYWSRSLYFPNQESFILWMGRGFSH